MTDNNDDADKQFLLRCSTAFSELFKKAAKKKRRKKKIAAQAIRRCLALRTDDLQDHPSDQANHNIGLDPRLHARVLRNGSSGRSSVSANSLVADAIGRYLYFQSSDLELDLKDIEKEAGYSKENPPPQHHHKVVRNVENELDKGPYSELAIEVEELLDSAEDKTPNSLNQLMLHIDPDMEVEKAKDWMEKLEAFFKSRVPIPAIDGRPAMERSLRKKRGTKHA